MQVPQAVAHAVICNRGNLRPMRERQPVSYHYNEKNDGADLYGVIVQWTKTDYSKKQLKKKFEGILALYQTPPTDPEEQSIEIRKKSSMKRKPMPYFRRVGPARGVIVFRTWQEANSFNDNPHLELRTFIPMSFVVTVGTAVFENTPENSIKMSEVLPYSGHFEVVHAHKKALSAISTLVTVAVRGSKLPSRILVKNRYAELHPHPRQPIHCYKCLRYGHLRINCIRKARCGHCAQNKPFLQHEEQSCQLVDRDSNIARCIHCNEGHPTAHPEECEEESVQVTYKAQLCEHRMDFVSTLEAGIIPGIRTTSINSNRAWQE